MLLRQTATSCSEHGKNLVVSGSFCRFSRGKTACAGVTLLFSCFFCAAVLGHLCRGRSHEWSHNLTECYCWLSLVWKSECAASLLSRAWMNRGHRGPTDVIYQLFTDVKSPIQRRSVVASASATGKTWRRQQRQQHQSTTNCVRLHHGCSVERRRRRPASIDRRRRQRRRLGRRRRNGIFRRSRSAARRPRYWQWKSRDVIVPLLRRDAGRPAGLPPEPTDVDVERQQASRHADSSPIGREGLDTLLHDVEGKGCAELTKSLIETRVPSRRKYDTVRISHVSPLDDLTLKCMD